jgi:hypothetical protein
MGVPVMMGVNLGLAAAAAGGGLLLLVALWWTMASDGVSVPRDRWPGPVRALAAVGWLLWIGGLAVQTAWFFGPVGVASWPH